MRKFILLFVMVAGLTGLNGCSESETEKCKKEASKLWNNEKNSDNKAYWQAIEKCNK